MNIKNKLLILSIIILFIYYVFYYKINTREYFNGIDNDVEINKIDNILENKINELTDELKVKEKIINDELDIVNLGDNENKNNIENENNKENTGHVDQEFAISSPEFNNNDSELENKTENNKMTTETNTSKYLGNYENNSKYTKIIN